VSTFTLITGNERKHEEIQALLGLPLARHALDLAEIQELDAHVVIAHKLREAQRELPGVTVLVEDTSLMLACLSGRLPGPLIRWFEDALTIEGIVALALKLGDMRATARTIIGHAAPGEAPRFFEGETHGALVTPRGSLDFGWGPAFLPEGCTKTFGEMTREEKHTVSMRARATEKLRDFVLTAPRT